MSVIVVPYDSVLQLRFVTGTDPETSAPIIRTKSFNRVKDTATEQNVFDVANELISLQNFSLDEIRLRQASQLTS